MTSPGSTFRLRRQQEASKAELLKRLGHDPKAVDDLIKAVFVEITIRKSGPAKQKAELLSAARRAFDNGIIAGGDPHEWMQAARRAGGVADV